MNFVIPKGAGSNLPNDMVNEIIDLITEKSRVLTMIAQRGNGYKITNEGTFPVISAADEDKVYLIENTDDITTLTENSFNITHPDLLPRELGTYFYLKKAQIRQYSELQLEELYKRKLTVATGKQAEKIVLAGTDGTGAATAAIRIADGIYTIACDASKCAATKVTYATKQTQEIVNAVIDAKAAVDNYADEEYADDLVIFAGKNFFYGSKKNADKDIIGFDYDTVPSLGLKKVPHIDGTPVFKRSNIGDDNAVLCNIKGARTGFRTDMELDVAWKAERRAYLNIVVYWFDFVWAFLNSSSKSEGLCKIEYAGS